MDVFYLYLEQRASKIDFSQVKGLGLKKKGLGLGLGFGFDTNDIFFTSTAHDFFLLA